MIKPSDHTNSGYDRGHNCPSADRTKTTADNDAVFLMTNITPEAHGMNDCPWEKLETYSRSLVSTGNTELLIYCGHGFSSATHATIGPNKVAMPDFGWKIVVVVPSGTGSIVSRITADTRVIAVRMPSINSIIKDDWRLYRTTVQEIENATGLFFFDVLSNDIADVLKNRIDTDGGAPIRGNFPQLPFAPQMPDTDLR